MPRALSRTITIHLTIDGEDVSHTFTKPDNSTLAILYRECVNIQTYISDMRSNEHDPVVKKTRMSNLQNSQNAIAAFWDAHILDVAGYTCDGHNLTDEDNWNELLPIEDKIRAALALLAPQNHGVTEKKT